jgi:hypothetical protein
MTARLGVEAAVSFALQVILATAQPGVLRRR